MQQALLYEHRWTGHIHYLRYVCRRLIRSGPISLTFILSLVPFQFISFLLWFLHRLWPSLALSVLITLMIPHFSRTEMSSHTPVANERVITNLINQDCSDWFTTLFFLCPFISQETACAPRSEVAKPSQTHTPSFPIYVNQ